MIVKVGGEGKRYPNHCYGCNYGSIEGKKLGLGVRFCG